MLWGGGRPPWMKPRRFGTRSFLLERSDEAISALCGNRRLGQFVEQRLGVLEVGGVEAFGEPAEDRGEEGGRLLRPALLSAQAGEAHGGAQFPGLCVLPARDV